MKKTKQLAVNQYITLEEFQHNSGMAISTIKKNIAKIPGIEKIGKDNYRVLRGTRYPANLRRFKSNNFGKKRYQLLKAIYENKYIDEKMLMCDKTQFEDFINELLEAKLINKNKLFNNFGANRYDTTNFGDFTFERIKAEKANKHILIVAEAIGTATGTALACYNKTA